MEVESQQQARDLAELEPAPLRRWWLRKWEQMAAAAE
jgi:hypothetical protein